MIQIIKGKVETCATFLVPWLLGVACGMALLMTKRYAVQLDQFNAVHYQEIHTDYISREIDFCGVVPVASVDHKFTSPTWEE